MTHHIVLPLLAIGPGQGGGGGHGGIHTLLSHSIRACYRTVQSVLGKKYASALGKGIASFVCVYVSKLHPFENV